MMTAAASEQQPSALSAYMHAFTKDDFSMTDLRVSMFQLCMLRTVAPSAIPLRVHSCLQDAI